MGFSMANFSLEVDRLVEFSEQMRLSEAALKKAIISAISKTLRGSFSRAKRTMGQETRVLERVLAHKVFLWQPNEKKTYGIMNILTYSVPAILAASKVSESGGGVSVNGRFFRGAFINFADRKRGSARRFVFVRQGGNKFPLFEERIGIKKAADRAILQERSEVSSRLINALEREIKLRAGLFD
jgi:hypothetical protein